MIKSFPNAGKANAEVFGRMLVEDVAATLPTVGALEAACRHLPRTNRFIPVIAEVLAALDVAEAAQRQAVRTLASLPEHKPKLLARIAADKARQEAREREVREYEQTKGP
ncbi:hypothetical protein [Bradyrhizobium sp.]|uniref:hypothetical protein n=1 Tax=Bradyrhizobium sp. TaxID=376 RepID=UPI003BAFBED3